MVVPVQASTKRAPNAGGQRNELLEISIFYSRCQSFDLVFSSSARKHLKLEAKASSMRRLEWKTTRKSYGEETVASKRSKAYSEREGSHTENNIGSG